MWLLQVAIPAHVPLFLWLPAWEEVSVYQELAAGSSYLLTLSPPLATRINELLGLRCRHHAPQLRDCVGRTSGKALHFTDEGKWGQKGRAATGLLCHWDQVQGVGRKQQSWAQGSGVSAMKASLGVGGLGTACTAKLSREDKPWRPLGSRSQGSQSWAQAAGSTGRETAAHQPNKAPGPQGRASRTLEAWGL